MRWVSPLWLLPVLSGCATEPAPPEPTLVLWAWERPEDLRFAPGVEVAAQVAFIELVGDGLEARGRRFALKVARTPQTAVIHVEINQRRTLRWTETLRARLAAAVLHYARAIPAQRVQVDFEVRSSERTVLLDLLNDVRRSLPRGTLLSMTALASWCETESWLENAPVDEIVPMLFRMQQGGETIKRRLAAGRDFRNPRCRTALGIATDSPLEQAPPGRRVYLFNPRSWTREEFERTQDSVGRWR